MWEDVVVGEGNLDLKSFVCCSQAPFRAIRSYYFLIFLPRALPHLQVLISMNLRTQKGSVYTNQISFYLVGNLLPGALNGMIQLLTQLILL